MSKKFQILKCLILKNKDLFLMQNAGGEVVDDELDAAGVIVSLQLM